MKVYLHPVCRDASPRQGYDGMAQTILLGISASSFKA
jgi:hypothetical protein